MTTQVVSLPVVNGGIGAGVATQQLARKRTFILVGVAGAVKIEASVDNVKWCPVATLTRDGDQTITIDAPWMRVNATGGSASGALVVAERSEIRSMAIPAPPGDGSPGAMVDVSALGPNVTLLASDVTGGVTVEVSGDGVSWGPVATFTQSSCKTACVAAHYMRAVGRNGSAMLWVGADVEGGDAVAAPRPCFVFQPGGVARGNVYTDWDLLMEAQLATPGPKKICLDNSFAPSGNLVIPSAGGGGARHDMTNVILSFLANTNADPGGINLTFGAGCLFENLLKIESPLGTAVTLNNNVGDDPVIILPDITSLNFGPQGPGFTFSNVFHVARPGDSPFLLQPANTVGVFTNDFGGLISGDETQEVRALLMETNTILYLNVFQQTTIRPNTLSSDDNTAVIEAHHPEAAFQKKRSNPQQSFHLGLQDFFTGTILVRDVCANGLIKQVRPHANGAPIDLNQITPNDFIIADASAPLDPVDAPIAANADGWSFTVRMVGDAVANPLVINAKPGELIEGGASFSCNTADTSYVFTCDGGFGFGAPQWYLEAISTP